jgi:hypothetical protein
MRQSDTMHTDHVTKIREEIMGVVDHARADVNNVDDPGARALFETTAEVLTGLAKAYDDFVKGEEPAWQR